MVYIYDVYFSCFVYMYTLNKSVCGCWGLGTVCPLVILTSLCNTVLSPVHLHWRYHSLALTHQHTGMHWLSLAWIFWISVQGLKHINFVFLLMNNWNVYRHESTQYLLFLLPTESFSVVSSNQSLWVSLSFWIMSFKIIDLQKETLKETRHLWNGRLCMCAWRIDLCDLALCA